MVSDERLIADLQEFAKELGEIPTRGQMDRNGPWDGILYHAHFGEWNDALKAAELDISKTSKDELIDDLKKFSEQLGEIPTYEQMRSSGPRSASEYEDHFGTWNNALRVSGLGINRFGFKELAGRGNDYYGSGYVEARRRTLERDNHKCRVCGETEELHCHHITPRREFDDVSESNTLNNLIMLCASCHGRFEGRWTDATPDEFAHWATLVHNS